MRRRDGSIVYFILGIYTLMISWYYNHSLFLLIIHYIFWPLYLIYEVLKGNLDNNMWEIIPRSYFK